VSLEKFERQDGSASPNPLQHTALRGRASCKKSAAKHELTETSAVSGQVSRDILFRIEKLYSASLVTRTVGLGVVTARHTRILWLAIEDSGPASPALSPSLPVLRPDNNLRRSQAAWRDFRREDVVWH
jgi:hypothetical protein